MKKLILIAILTLLSCVEHTQEGLNKKSNELKDKECKYVSSNGLCACAFQTSINGHFVFNEMHCSSAEELGLKIWR